MRTFEQRVNFNLRWAFFIVLSLKILAAIVAFVAREPMLWGIYIPLGVFLLYIAYGVTLVWNASERTRLNFADGCYYLGFLFTITTIVLALADASQAGKLHVTDISIRFAGAMASTVIGMIVRLVYVLFERKKAAKQALNPEQQHQLSLLDRLFPKQSDQLEVNISYADQLTKTSEQDPFETLIRSSCKNISLFNELIGNSLREYEDLNERLKTLNARILADAEYTRESLTKESKEWLDDSKRQMDELMDAYREGMSKQLEDASKASMAITEAHAQNLEAQAQKAAQTIEEKAEANFQTLLNANESSFERMADASKLASQALVAASEEAGKALIATSEETGKALISANQEASEALVSANKNATQVLAEVNAEASATFKRDAEALHASLQTMTQSLTKGLTDLNDDFKAKSDAILTQHKTLGESLKGSETALSDSVNKVRTNMETVSEEIKTLATKIDNNVDLKNVRNQIAELESATQLLNTNLKKLADKVEKEGFDLLTHTEEKRSFFGRLTGR